MISRALTFLAGALVGAALVFFFVTVKQPKPATTAAVVPVVPATPGLPTAIPTPPVASVTTPAPPTNAAPPPLAAATPGDLTISMPVKGVNANELIDTYTQTRGGGRMHEALDIMAPHGREVLAVSDGKITKLFNSKQGGLTIYQFDPSERYAFYYAHLDRYADGIQEGKILTRGDLVGYVGATGNADPAAPHLHFAIFELGAEKRWWEGRPVNPYPLLAQRQGPS